MTILTVFRSRLRPETEAAYHRLAVEMSQLASETPGFLEEKTFVADDGERITLVLFSDSFSHAAWRDHPRHREAQEIGRRAMYSEYHIYSAEIDYASTMGR
jgi:heme-degrading monooxygenase HmoA